MVKNIVFDIGNVLATFNPKKFLEELFHDEHIVDAFYPVFFCDVWNLYDKGEYLKEDVIRIGIEKLPMYEKEIRYMMDVWPSYVCPIQSSMELIEEYKDLYDLYIVSNLPEDSYVYLKEHYSFIQKMNGGIYSYQELLIKPDPKIFELLLNRYSLKAQECLFIDDRLANVEMANQLGFHTIHLENPEELSSLVKEKLNEM